MPEKEHNILDKQLWDLLEEFHSCYFELDKDKNFIYANKKMQNLVGYNYKELVGKNLSDFLTRFYTDQTSEVLDDAAKDKKKYKFLMDFIKKDKTVILLDVSGMCYFHNDELIAFRALVSDGTDIQQKQSELWIKNAAIDRSTSGIIITDLNHHIYYANEAAYEMFKYTGEDELSHLCISDLWQNDKEYNRYKKDLENDGEYNVFGVEMKRKDGSIFEGQIYASTARDKV